MTLTETVRAQTRQAVAELLAAARMRAGDIFIIGCSSSEVVGQRIGRGSSMEAAQAVWEGAAPLLAESGLYLAAQCCEHLNRAIVVERAALPPWAETVKRPCLSPTRAVPLPPPHMRTWRTPYWWRTSARARALTSAAHSSACICGLWPSPVRLSLARIGEAGILCARTRPKYIGGSRAVYQTDELEVPR